MGEQRFKVGDWVRSLVNWGDIEAGKIYQIPHLDGDGEPWFTPDGTGGWSDYLTLDEIEPWQPRVGERVRVNFAGWEGEGEVTAEEHYGILLVTMKTGTYAGQEGGFLARDIEPILTAAQEQPATLKIEAGKFYKTRDGRKVGPAFISGNTATFGSTGNYASAVWSDDGRSSSRDDKTSLKDNDIIAEWIDEPAAKASNDNAQPKFKVGDRVRVVKTGFVSGGSGHSAKIGDEFVLREMNPSKAFWRTNGPDFYEHEIELVVFASIVALIENGQPKPSSTPHVHASSGAAEKEAKRLAAKYKGKQFGVFTLTTTHHEPKPVYDHKWQNMAAMGLKIDAIKELRAVAGIPQGHAERIVGQFAA
jgi:hypothetical protein